MVRMAGDAERVLPANLAQDVVGALIGGDPLGQPERDDVRVLAGLDMVLRDLGAGNDEQPVLAPRPLGLLGDLVEIGAELDPRAPRSARRPSVASRAARASRSFFIRM